MKTTLKLAVLAAAVLGATVLPAARSQSAGASALPRCASSTLYISPVKNSGQGAMGHVSFVLSIRSFAQHTCYLQGFPGAQLIDARARFLPTHLQWGSGYLFGIKTKPLVSLQTGGYAYFALEWDHIPTGNEACPVATTLLVTPPDETVSVVVPLATGIDACGGRLTATPVLAKPPY